MPAALYLSESNRETSSAMDETSPTVTAGDSAEVSVENFAFTAPVNDILDFSGAGPQERPQTAKPVEDFRPLTKSLRDELVRLYFHHVHPLCPVVDEFSFCNTYFAVFAEDELFERIDPVIFYAMMFLAFTHIDKYWLRHSPYETVAHGQRTLVRKAKTLYELHPPDDHLTLVQAALLLTFWSPYDADDQVNSFWVKQAFHHANRMRLWDPNQDSGTLGSRRLVIWWCCLTRDRLTTCGLRRPQELHDTESICPTPDIADFGYEAIFPPFTDVAAKHLLLRSFIWLCKLSDIMKSVIIVTREAVRHGHGSASIRGMEASMDKAQDISKQLKAWMVSYQTQVEEEERRVTSRYNRMPIRILNILGDSLTVSLYTVFVQIPPCHSIVRKARAAALLQMRDTAIRVNYNVEFAMESAKVEDVPQWLVAWIILPIVCLQVRSYIHGAHADHLVQIASLSTMLSSLHSRFGGVKYVANMMRQIDSMMRECSRLKAAASELPGGASVLDDPANTEEAELEMLDFAIRLVDLNLASRPTL